MKLRTALSTIVAGCALALAHGAAMGQIALCSSITTIGAWESAGSCVQGDKLWTIGDNTLDTGVQVLFSPDTVLSTHAMQIIGFDTSDSAGAWSLDYTISVTDPNFVINAMFAGADNPGGGSTLTKDVTGDATFSLSVLNGVEGPASEQTGLSATTLNVSEDFSVLANASLLSVSNTFTQTEVSIPEPGTLALFGLGLAGFAVFRRRLQK